MQEIRRSGRTFGVLWTIWAIGCLLPRTVVPAADAEVDSQTGAFSYSDGKGIDETLGQIALYLIDLKRTEGSNFLSEEVDEGTVGYQLRYFDNGNRVVDTGDWMSVRRYNVPAQPDTTKPAGYYKSTYVEFVDRNMNGIDNQDYYFINGRHFSLQDEKEEILKQYQVQIESGISAYIGKVGYGVIRDGIGSLGQTAIMKTHVYEDGSLPARLVLGLDLNYVFRPITGTTIQLTQDEMLEEIKQQVGFAYSTTIGYTDISGFRRREIAGEVALMQRAYDPMEREIVRLVIDALFDTDGDGVITQENIKTGLERQRQLHDELVNNARGMKRRIVLPNEKIARLRKEYEALRRKPFTY